MPREGENNSTREERRDLIDNNRTVKEKRRRLQALQAMNGETVDSLDQIFEAKLNAVRIYEQRLARVTDPYAKQALEKMIQDERRQLLNLAELIDLVEESPDMGRFTRATRQMTHRLKAGNGKNIAYGLGAIALAALLIPGVKDALKPLASKVINGVNDLTEQAQGLISGVREDVEDLVAEAQFDKIKQSIDNAVVEDDFFSDPNK
ncbi:hypothetical protein [Dendrosporobacter sp. 1207_IL3150]|uniref:hypothetical protein n=1 Tax=Dendrosporobacter sp. 1207_IL3150 TaxID=3084054 RepID=UPI002FDA877C